MPYTIEYLAGMGIVFINNVGRLTKEDFVRQTQEALEIGNSHSCRLYLADCTSMAPRLTTMEIYATPKVYEELDAPRTNKLALVTAEDRNAREDIRFYETVCLNRGWPVRVFNNKQEAINWLNE